MLAVGANITLVNNRCFGPRLNNLPSQSVRNVVGVIQRISSQWNKAFAEVQMRVWETSGKTAVDGVCVCVCAHHSLEAQVYPRMAFTVKCLPRRGQDGGAYSNAEELGQTDLLAKWSRVCTNLLIATSQISFLVVNLIWLNNKDFNLQNLISLLLPSSKRSTFKSEINVCPPIYH